jgi:hypothetical protein
MYLLVDFRFHEFVSICSLQRRGLSPAGGAKKYRSELRFGYGGKNKTA